MGEAGESAYPPTRATAIEAIVARGWPRKNPCLAGPNAFGYGRTGVVLGSALQITDIRSYAPSKACWRCVERQRPRFALEQE
jgi:hypothetical protein